MSTVGFTVHVLVNTASDGVTFCVSVKLLPGKHTACLQVACKLHSACPYPQTSYFLLIDKLLLLAEFVLIWDRVLLM